LHDKDLQQAKGRPQLAERALQAMKSAADDPTEFQTHWLDFLVQWKGTYSKIGQASKSSPQEVQWFGGVNAQRKADPLLCYNSSPSSDHFNELAKPRD
jgi:hypothetical protein